MTERKPLGIKQIDFRAYLTKTFKVIHVCNNCKEQFEDYELAKKHVIENHNIEIELKMCDVCKSAFIPDIPNQIVCSNRECLFGGLEGKND